MRIGILGAGVGGLATAYFLRGTGATIAVHEAADAPGGLARSFPWQGFDCDFAPHRLYTEDAAILAEIARLTPLNRIRRRSRIYAQGRWLPMAATVIKHSRTPSAGGNRLLNCRHSAIGLPSCVFHSDLHLAKVETTLDEVTPIASTALAP